MMAAQVDDCIAKYEWMAHMTSQMAALKRAGKPVPRTIDEMEGMLGEIAASCPLMSDGRNFETQYSAAILKAFRCSCSMSKRTGVFHSPIFAVYIV